MFRTDRSRVKFFAWSHIFGWLLANIQTIWLAWEVRRVYNLIKNKEK